jgi:hypothetical protein
VQCGTQAHLLVPCDSKTFYHLHVYRGEGLAETVFNLRPNTQKQNYLQYIGGNTYSFDFDRAVPAGTIVLFQTDAVVIDPTDLTRNNVRIVQKIPYSVHCDSKQPSKPKQPVAIPSDPGKRSELFVKACGTGDIETVKAVLATGLNPDSIRDHMKRTPLYDAVIGGHLSVVSALIARKAKVNLFEEGAGTLARSPLTYAIEGDGVSKDSHLEMMKWLINADKSIVNRPNELEITPLIYAIRSGRPNAVALLLRMKSNLEWKDSNGWTALTWAVAETSSSIVPLLLAAGAKTDMLDKKGRTLFDIAREHEGDYWVDMLKKMGVTQKNKSSK